MRTNWFHILAALTGSELHGSAIAEDVHDQTGGALRLWPATLYRTLDELVEVGFVEELTGGRHPAGESKRKRFYRATPRGRRELARAANQLSEFAGLALTRLGDGDV